MKNKTRSRIFWLLICALLLSLAFPISAVGQGRWYRGRARTGPVVVYRYPPRPYGIYRNRAYDYRSRAGYQLRPSYDRHYQSYRYRYAPVHNRDRSRFRLRFRW